MGFQSLKLWLFFRWTPAAIEAQPLKRNQSLFLIKLGRLCHRNKYLITNVWYLFLSPVCVVIIGTLAFMTNNAEIKRKEENVFQITTLNTRHLEQDCLFLVRFLVMQLTNLHNKSRDFHIYISVIAVLLYFCRPLLLMTLPFGSQKKELSAMWMVMLRNL